MTDDDQIYAIDPNTGALRIRPDEYDYFKWRFDRAGIAIDSITTVEQFESACRHSREYAEEALLHSVSKMKNPYARAAFEALLRDGDIASFEKLGKRAEQYSRMKKHSVNGRGF